MKSKLHFGRGAAILACAASLAGTAVAIAPVAPALAATTCGNKTVKLPQEGAKPYPILVKAISVEGGATCAESASVIAGVLVGKPPTGWKSVIAHYELPKALAEEGLLPQLVKKGSKKIKFAVHGG
jgi:hypothetical protein